MVDEAQHLSDQALDQLRSVHDACGIGIALIGNRDLYTRVNGGESASYLDALRDRIGKRIALAGVSPGDVDAILDAWGTAPTRTRKAMVEACAKGGGLRNLMKTLRLAIVHAQAAGHRLSDVDVRAAWRDLGGGA